MSSSRHHLVIQVRNAICVLWLLISVVFEGYTAAGIALSWESKLGWFLFVLPCELLIALVLLIRRVRARLGFHLVAANLFFYAVFIIYCEAMWVHQTQDTVTLTVVGLWATFLALAIGAAYFLRDQTSTSR